MTQCTQEIGYLQSINSEKHLPLQVNFLDDDLTSMSLISLRPRPSRIPPHSPPKKKGRNGSNSNKLSIDELGKNTYSSCTTVIYS
jgi:hypothetical protein